MIAAAAAGALAALYAVFLLEPVLTWGATPEEAAGSLPGDELLPDWDGGATRAIAISAPAQAGCRPSGCA